ncbi:MAG: gamma-glutamyl-gamma-aminobutyrate hydrolase family protein [Pseudomonadota bacterium]
MRISILETGAPPEEAREPGLSYGQMMVDMLSPRLPGADFAITRVHDGDAPPNHNEIDGSLITGSPAGIYEDHAFIPPLLEAIRNAAQASVPQVGICFGHQAMAVALGGRVSKSDKGWGVGVHQYKISATLDWMDHQVPTIGCAVSHQDQVMGLPEGATVFAGSAFCPNGAIQYAGGAAISFQMHPEFSHHFAAKLLNVRADRIPEETASEARRTLDGDSDRAVIADWIATFFTQKHHERTAV